MFRLIKFLFTGDWHICVWEEIEAVSMVRGSRSTYSEQHYKRYTLRCSCCGEMKTFNTN